MPVVEQNMWFPEVVAKWEAVVVERLQVEEEALVVESSDVQVNLSAAATTNSPRRAPFLPSLRQALVETATSMTSPALALSALLETASPRLRYYLSETSP